MQMGLFRAEKEMKITRENLKYKLQNKDQRWQLHGELTQGLVVTSEELEQRIKKNRIEKAFYVDGKVCVRLQGSSNWFEEL